MLRRIDEAEARQARVPLSAGISPGRCPAIRAAARLGLVVGAPYTCEIHNRKTVVVEAMRCSSGDISLLPGVIGEWSSERIFARIDTGFSFERLPCPVLSTTPLETVSGAPDIYQPNVLYETGYAGPLLVPLSSGTPHRVETGDAITQLVPLSDVHCQFEIVNSDTQHPEFEGLLDRSWKSWTLIRTLSSNDLLRLGLEALI